MPHNFKLPRFEDFILWLGQRHGNSSHPAPAASDRVLAAARAAWGDFRAVERHHRAELAERLAHGGYYEEIELLAAAETAPHRWLPRLRTPNGFAISVLYAGDAVPGAAPVGVLVECPESLLPIVRGLEVRFLCAGRWISLGKIDGDGKAAGDLPRGIEFKPPLGLRVGGLEYRSEETPEPDSPG